MSRSTSSATANSKSSARNRKSSDQSVLNPASFNGSAANLPLDGNSIATAVADFNRDGILDVAVTLSSSAISSNLAIFLGTGDGSFNSAGTFVTDGLSPYSVIADDFNQDGNPDLVTANFGSDTVSLLLGNGSGSFQTAQTFRVGSQPNAVISGDFNEDGRLDLVTANSGTDANSVSVLLGNDTGFSSATRLEVAGTQPLALATGDFDRDGNLDFVSADSSSISVSVFLGKGNGEFKDAEQFFVGGTAPVTIVTGDFDGDNKLDIATGNLGNTGRDISILFGDGKGDFPDGKIIAAGGGINSLVSGDFNGDGSLDLAGTLVGSSSLTTLLGDGEGEFVRSGNTFLSTSPAGLSVADFDQDGKPDLISASGSSSNASIVLNKTSYVLLRSTKQTGTVDGSLEKKSSIEVNLDTGNLTIKSSPIVRTAIDEFDDVLGTQVKDKITGSDERNSLSGNDGQDKLLGLDGNDSIVGGRGKDQLDGDAGDDRLTGSIGSDRLKGDAGKDRFIFDDGTAFSTTNGQDRISDFEQGRDKIVLDRGTFTALGSKVSFASVQSLDAAGNSASLITYVRSTGRLYYNADGSTAGFGTGGWFATLDNAKSADGALAAGDFLTQR